ncbi:hypothetical protein [Amycolatopsis speibonae]|uniref:IPT/TIG domain-containing protein n=1 Tax=Amycolatopsis speibonae TaxID=1450224 RepID=A0ABV7P2S8_9PSEU
MPLTATSAVAVAAPAVPVADSPAAAVRTVTVSGGAEYASYVPQATEIWNSPVPNIRMVQVSGRGNVTITVGTGGGSRATIGHELSQRESERRRGGHRQPQLRQRRGGVPARAGSRDRMVVRTLTD